MLRNTLNTFISATLIMLLGVSSSASAQTIVPMGDLMGSTSVTWGNDNQETTKSSALRVDLVPAAPRIKQDTSDESIDEQLPGEPVTVAYTITSEANGPDDYALAADYDDGAAAEANLVDSPTTEILGADGQSASVNLGATAATGPTDKDSTTITVICDENYPSNSEISCNGIEASDTVIIGDGDTAYTVADGGVSNTGDGPSTIRLDDGVALPSIVVGTRIAEQKTFEVVVTGVALRDPAEPGAVSLAVTGTSTDGNQGQELLAFDVTANPIPRSVDRYVRNLTDPNRNPAAEDVESTELALTDGDADTEREAVNYYKTGVSAEEGDEVEILIVLKAGNLEDQTDIMLTDTLSPFVEYIEGSTLFFANGGEEGASMVPFGKNRADSRNFLVLMRGAVDFLDLAKNTSAHLSYQVKVIGGVGDDSGEEKLGDAEVSKSELGTPWGDGSDMLESDTPCWCDGEDIPVFYCTAQGWAAGVNGFDLDDDNQAVLRSDANAELGLGLNFAFSDFRPFKCR
jgi:hypothetical protein